MTTHYEKVQLDQGLPIKFHHFLMFKETHDVVKHWHNSVEIVMPVEGSIYIWDNGFQKEVHKGEIYIFNSRHVHQTYWLEDTSYYEGYCIQINYDYIKKLINNHRELVFRQPDEHIVNQMKNLILSFADSYENTNQFSNLRIQGNVISLIYVMCVNLMLIPEKKSRSTKKQHRIDEIVSYIESNYSDDLSVETIAANMDMTTRYLNKLFKDNFGQTPKEYLMSYRLKKSVEMLLNTDYAIVDIAIANGFPNMNSFYKYFELSYGRTPKQYRRLMNSTN